jgi:intracellular septation protein
MKFLFDMLPLLVFFGTFKLGESFPETAHQIVAIFMNGVSLQQSPIILATAMVILATALQVGYLKVRGRKVDVMLWVTFGVIVVFGGATIYFNNETFIKWKPTMIYWLFAIGMFVAQFVFKKNLMRQAMEQQIKLPDLVWRNIGLAWMTLFFVLGFVNLIVAFVIYEGNTSAWVTFKSFGLTGILFVFIIAQTLMLAKYLEEEPK